MSTHNLKFSFNPGRTNGDNWDTYLPEDIHFWAEGNSLIKDRTYKHDGCAVVVSADWRPVVRKLKKIHSFNLDFHSPNRQVSKYLKDECIIKIRIEIDGKNELSEYWWYPNFFLEHYVYEIFTILNLARPGVCEFYNAYMHGYSTRDSESMEKIRIPLSAYDFEVAWENHNRGNSPSLMELPLADVIVWYEKLELGVRQRAYRPIEKCLFSMLHICRSDQIIASVVWVFHAMESLFTTKVGEGFSNLIDRISVVLKCNEKQKAILKKNLRKLYDLRGALIHGGYEIYHPMEREVIDDAIDDQYMEIHNCIHFGGSVILACMQVFISNGWYGFDVEEKLVGRIEP